MTISQRASGLDDDKPASGHQLACFGAGCFWGVELAYQRVPGMTKSEVVPWTEEMVKYLFET
jgi:hypothetical protein